MKVIKESVTKHYTSCNFCSKWEYHKWMWVIRPYDEVFTFCNDSGNWIKTSICKECCDELFNKINNL